MKLRPVTKIDKRNKTTSQNWRWAHFGKLWRHCYFPIYNQFGAIRKPDSGRIVRRIYIFINSNLLSCKNWKKTLKKSLTQLDHTFALSRGTILAKKHWFFAKNADISKIKRALVLKGIFFETTYVCVCILSAEFEISSIILNP